MLVVSVAGSQCNCVCILQSVYYGLYFARDNTFSFTQSFFLCTMLRGPRPPDNTPIDDIEKGDDVEPKKAEKETKESAERGDEVHRAHPDAPLEL